MSYETQPGYPYSPRFRVLDGFGSPVTSGIVATVTVKGPTGATLTSGSATHLGDGYWGLSVAGSLLTALGTYTWSTGAITGTAMLAAQAGTFVVGVGDLLSLREVYTNVRFALRDGRPGVTTQTGTMTTLVAARFAGMGSNNRWKGSEIVILEPASLTDPNPVYVTAFTASSGTFTINQALGSNSQSGVDFWLGNKEGRGWTHDEVLNAILGAIRRIRAPRSVSDQVSIPSTAYNQFEYPMANWLAVDGVEYQPDAGTPTLWEPLPPVYYTHIAERGVLRLEMPMPNNAVRIIGRAVPALPATFGDLVQADAAIVQDDALYELKRRSDDPGDRQEAAMLGPGVLRARAGAGLARL